MFRFKVDVSKANAGIRGMFKRSLTITNAMKEVGKFWKKKVQQGFAQQRDPYGGKWVPLTDTTLALRKARGGSGSRILFESGEMFRSLNVNATNKTVNLTMDDWSQIHQYGNPSNLLFGKTHAPIPQRMIFPVRGGAADLPSSWARPAAEIVGTYIETGR